MATEILEVEVQSNIKGVTKDVDKLGKSLKNTTQETEDLGKATKTGATGFKRVGTAVRALGTAMKAIGIGLVIGAFLALKEAFAQNQKVIDVFKTAMTTITTTFNEVVVAIIEVVKWATATEGRFTALGKVISGFVTLGINPLKQAFYTVDLAIRMFGNAILVMMNLLGADNTKRMEENQAAIKKLGKQILETGEEIRQGAIDIKENWGEATDSIADLWEKTKEEMSKIDVKANIEKAKALTEAEKQARRAEVALQGLIEKNDRLAELQRQIRDNETKTFAERIAANKKLGEILDEQEISMLAQADARIHAAQLAKANNKDNLELELALTAAINDRAAVEAQIAGFRSEQQTNKVALDKELLETTRMLTEEMSSSIDREKEELDNWYAEKLTMAKRSGFDLEKVHAEFNRRDALLTLENNDVKLAAFSHLAGALSQLAGENKELAIAQAIIDTWAGATKALTVTGTPIDWINAAAIIATGLANVRKIMQTNVPGASGGGSMPSGAAPQPPSSQMMSGAFTLGGGQEVEPARAYVVSDDITNNQNKLAIIRRRATI
jgi:hypothetical protein